MSPFASSARQTSGQWAPSSSFSSPPLHTALQEMHRRSSTKKVKGHSEMQPAKRVAGAWEVAVGSDPPPLSQPQSPKRYSDGSSQALTHRSQEAPPSPAPRRWPPAEAARAVRVRTRNIVVRAVTRFALAARVAACGEAVELPGALEGWMGRGRRREAHAFALSCTWSLVGRP